jgi:hypothetical protein
MINKKNLKMSALIVLVLIAGAGFYAYKEYNRTNNILTNARPDFTKTPEELINEFTSNEKEANTKYLDKIILLSGNIKSIDKDEKGYYTIALGDTASMSSVRCSIDSTYTAQASTLPSTGTIHIKGICTGFNADEMGVGSDVILNRCVIITK